jgi:hypothetical protein
VAAGDRSVLGAVAGLIGVAVVAVGCTRAVGAGKAGEVAKPDPLAPLLAWENATRAHTDFAHAPASDVALGPDPYVVRSLTAITAPAAPAGEPARSARYVGILRGRAALVVLDADLAEIARLPAPESPGGLAVAPNGDLFVAGELSDRVARYRRRGGVVEEAGAVALPGVRAIRDVAAGPEGVVYVVEEHDGRLVTFTPPSSPAAPAGAEMEARGREDTAICHAPVRVVRAGRSVVVDCVLDHAFFVRSDYRRG